MLIVIAGGIGHSKHKTLRRKQWEAMATRAQELALGKAAQRVIIDMLGFSAPVLAMVPTDGTVLEATVGSSPKDARESTIPSIKLRPGLVLIEGLKDADGRAVPVCMRNLHDGPVRFYPGMSPYHFLTLLLLTLGMTFVNSAILAIAVSFPLDASVVTNCEALGGFGGKERRWRSKVLVKDSNHIE